LNIPKPSIGTRNESSLHRALKLQYAGYRGKTEIKAGEFVTDGKRADGEYIEVQTGSFAPLEKKLKKISKNAKVRVIYPVFVKKIIEVYKPSRGRKKCGKLLYRRKSPLKGTQWDIFDALVYSPKLPLIKGVTIEIVLLDITEKRIKDGKGSRRRKGISIYDKELILLHESVHLKKTADYRRFVPFMKNEVFISSLLAERAGIAKRTARKALYVLTKMKIVKRIGKKGNSWKYVRK